VNIRTLALILLISLMVFQSSIAVSLAISMPEARCTLTETDQVAFANGETGVKPSGDQIDTPSMPS
jgi:hypothetical protein